MLISIGIIASSFLLDAPPSLPARSHAKQSKAKQSRRFSYTENSDNFTVWHCRSTYAHSSPLLSFTGGKAGCCLVFSHSPVVLFFFCQAMGMEHRVEDSSNPEKMRWQVKPLENRSLYVPTRCAADEKKQLNSFRRVALFFLSLACPYPFCTTGFFFFLPLFGCERFFFFMSGLLTALRV